MVRSSRPVAVSLAALLFSIALPALAQKPKKTNTAKPAPAAEPEPSPTSSPPPQSAAAASEAEPKAEPTATESATVRGVVTPEPVEESASDTREDPSRRYYFVGLRYRGTIIPKFLVNLFVNEGATFYSNTVGVELDMRKDGQSIIPWLAFTEYGFGDTLFFQKNKEDIPQNYSVVSSTLKGIYAGLDELWSSPLANHLDLEYGFGVGVGFIFGDLMNNWVHLQDPDGPLVASNGHHYAPCQAGQTLPGCNTADHENATIAKVGGYVEPNWFNGGSVPVIFPHLAGQIGLRYKPIRALEMRLGVGISLTGFWFGISGDYGLTKPESSEHNTSRQVRQRDTL